VNLKLAKSKPTSVERFLNYTIIFWIIGFFLTYTVTFYFGWGEYDKTISFQSSDLPGNLQEGCTIDALGNHYFGDLMSVLCHSKLESPYISNVVTNYFPLSYVILRPLLFIVDYGIGSAAALLFLTGFPFIFVPLWFALSGDNIKHRRIFIILCLLISQPFLSLLDRGNIQILTTGFIVFGLYMTDFRKSQLGPIFLGLAIATKGYPGIYLIQYLRQKQWKEVYVACRTCGLATLTSLILFKGGLIENTKHMIEDIRGFKSYGDIGLPYNNSLKGLLFSMRQIGAIPNDIFRLADKNLFLIIITIISIGVLLLLSGKTSKFDSAMICAAVSCLVLDLTPSYVLTLFFIPILYISVIKTNEITDNLQLAAIALLFAPKNIPLLNPDSLGQTSTVSMNSLLNPALMIGILGIQIYSYGRKTWK
jgi:hypothetical protein